MVAADHLLVCGVSNWGGFALGASLSVLRAADDDEAGDTFPEVGPPGPCRVC